MQTLKTQKRTISLLSASLTVLLLGVAVIASRATIVGSNAPVDIQSASVLAALASLPATGAGPEQPQTQAQSVDSAIAVVTPAATSGGGRGCVGSPC